MKKKRKIWPWIVVALLAAVGAIALLGGKKGSSYTLETAVASFDKIEQNVTATGEVQPVYKVTVGTQVSGIVKNIYVDYNSRVKKGDLLAELDKSVLQEEINIARANLDVVTSQCDLAQKTFDRVKSLYESKAASRQEYEEAEAHLQQAKSQMVQSKATYDNAVTNLRYAEIYSPIDGVVISRKVEEGQTVQGAYSVPDLFVIAKNMTEMKVEANVDEADIGQVQVGQQVRFRVDAYPDDEFSGTVSQIRKEPHTTNNVVAYPVIILADNPDEKLFPGMTATVTIVVRCDSGLVVPYYATLLKPDGEALAALSKQGYTVDTVVADSSACGTKNTVWIKLF